MVSICIVQFVCTYISEKDLDLNHGTQPEIWVLCCAADPLKTFSADFPQITFTFNLQNFTHILLHYDCNVTNFYTF